MVLPDEQLMPVGLEVTAPLPVPAVETVSVSGIKVKVALTLSADELMMTVQVVAVPLQTPPDQPANVVPVVVKSLAFSSNGADATLTVSYDTAVDLATGRRDGSDVFDAGLVRFEGDLAKLQAATATLAAVAETLALVRSRTTFAPVRAGTTC